MKRSALYAFFVLVAFTSNAALASYCVGQDTDPIQTCHDDSGNTYRIRRMGDVTTVDGSNDSTGSSWSQRTVRRGENTTYTTGVAANGAEWDETAHYYDNGRRSVDGTNSKGQSYHYDCTRNGCE
ncbi:hypothetical protein LMG28688_04218 [Paraburkholderia caffeinitolerans]|uniref:Uncharacterized protein n=1 Tax=Paraburkholderia caffeinitolerans TaxID=1723730 RepID=A0A6J5G9Y9_9BURK|nr:hypothetical protein [Paraburkholderia dokdonensis]CAB3796022.1 hypothetical protein LMG28688_04218 [Paraburkholderia caffeinitolerans]